MSVSPPQLNVILAWLWIALGVVFGFVLGNFFHREDWLGGYASLKRRLYRLAHISIFGLAILNLLFYLSVKDRTPLGTGLILSSWGFLVGAVSMPLCCLAMAHRPKLRALFLIPVLSLAISGFLTFWEVLKP
jgi:hypothetical protein